LKKKTPEEMGQELIHCLVIGKIELARAKELIEQGASVLERSRYGDYTALYLAAQHGFAEITQMLLDRGAHIEGNTLGWGVPLLQALCYHRNDVAKILIQAGADVNARDVDGEHIIVWAVHNNNAEGVRLLLEQKVELNFTLTNEKTFADWVKEVGAAGLCKDSTTLIEKALADRARIQKEFDEDINNGMPLRKNLVVLKQVKIKNPKL
jgi:ankyrin repeat protein